MALRMTNDIVDYWSKRAESYSKQNQDELKEGRGSYWLNAMKCFFPDDDKEKIRILDIGTGPGFFSIILAEDGYRPDAADCTEEMLSEARNNAGELAERITFSRMNADDLDFPDNTFDIIVSRNLTWNLEDPCICYTEWNRVLKPGGKMIIFDANWYRYLFDDSVKKQYDKDRENVARQKLKDFNIGHNYDVMEKIAEELPMSKKMRPEWDRKRLLELGYTDVTVDPDIWENVWSEEEKINYTATPMFRIVATK